jgi:hypothetical protein
MPKKKTPVMNVRRIVVQNCSTDVSIPSERWSVVPQYERVILVLKDGSEITLYEGDEFSSDRFRYKQTLESEAYRMP